MTPAAVSLGSNMGDRRAVLGKAVARLAELGRLQALSPLYETAPVGPVEQQPFYNAVAVVETDLEPEDLVERLLAIEKRLGRVRGPRWGPRIIDLDLILHGDSVVRTVEVSVPHPRYRQRRFVMEPLAAAWPEARDPDGTRVSDLLAGVADQDVTMIEERWWRGQRVGDRGSRGGGRSVSQVAATRLPP